MLKKIIIVNLIIITILYLNNLINNNNKIITNLNSNDKYLEIESINLKEKLYEKDNELNTLNIGLEVFYEEPLVILGHSGTAENALFNDLDKVKKGDIVKVSYYDKIDYKVKEIKKKRKKDKLQLESDLILVSCDRKNKDLQIVVLAEKILSNY